MPNSAQQYLTITALVSAIIVLKCDDEQEHKRTSIKGNQNNHFNNAVKKQEHQQQKQIGQAGVLKKKRANSS